MSITLEESQRTLDRINDDPLDPEDRPSDRNSAITDSTDVLLKAKPYPNLTGPNVISTNRRKPTTWKNLSCRSGLSNAFETTGGGHTSRIKKTLAKQEKIKYPKSMENSGFDEGYLRPAVQARKK